MRSGIQKNVQKSSREEEILPKIMILDPKEVSRPKMSLIEVVRRHKIDFGTKLQVVWSMYEVRNPKNDRKSSREEEIWPKIMILDPKEVSKPKMSLIEVVKRQKIDFGTKLQVCMWSWDQKTPKT